MRVAGSPHKINMRNSPHKRRISNRGIPSDNDGIGGYNLPGLLPSLTFLMGVLFLLSLVTMVMFYSQLQVAEEEIG